MGGLGEAVKTVSFPHQLRIIHSIIGQTFGIMLAEDVSPRFTSRHPHEATIIPTDRVINVQAWAHGCPLPC